MLLRQLHSSFYPGAVEIFTIIHQLMTLNTRFQEAFMKGKNHPTLKDLWKKLAGAMEWAELDDELLENMAGVRRQFRFAT
jgi:hypothetical protein